MDEKELEELAAKKIKEVYDVLKNKDSQRYKNFLAVCENKTKEEIIYDVNVYKEVFSVEDEIAEEVFSAVTRNKIYDLVKNTADKENASSKKKTSKKDSSSAEKGKKHVNVPFFIMLVIAVILLITVVGKNSTIDNLQKANQLLIEEKENLQSSYQKLEKENDELKNENSQLQDQITNYWEMYSGRKKLTY